MKTTSAILNTYIRNSPRDLQHGLTDADGDADGDGVGDLACSS